MALHYVSNGYLIVATLAHSLLSGCISMIIARSVNQYVYQYVLIYTTIVYSSPYLGWSYLILSNIAFLIIWFGSYFLKGTYFLGVGMGSIKKKHCYLVLKFYLKFTNFKTFLGVKFKIKKEIKERMLFSSFRLADTLHSASKSTRNFNRYKLGVKNKT